MATPTHIARIIDSLDCNKSPGSDGIRVKDLKEIKNLISPVIAYFIHLCVKESKYPNRLKESIIRPIYKQGSHLEYTNCRPIAILNTINKIVEKFIVNQITTYLDKNNIITDIQHGFRPNRSTATALARFTDDVNNYLNDKNIVVAVFIDFKKAFDTLDHDGLLQAMDECGISGPINKWFGQYLDQRTIKVRVANAESVEGIVKYGVPTGSVYGPVGYIVHVNSMCNVIKKCKAYMYADDTCLLFSGTDQTSIQEAIQDDLDSIIKWAHDNGIIINVSKTKCMPIHSPYSRNKNIDLNIKGHSYECLHNGKLSCKCINLEQVKTYKYLGLTIDTKFAWNIHIDTVCNKVRSVLGKLYTLKPVVKRGILYALYYALADSIISYGLCGYGLTFKTYLDKIKLLQTRLLKMLVSKRTKQSLNKEYDKLFKKCNILPVDMKVKMTMILEQHNINKHKKEKVHNYPTRLAKKKKLQVPYVNNYYGKRTRRWITPTLINELPEGIIDRVKNKNHLKNVLRKHYLSMCP